MNPITKLYSNKVIDTANELSGGTKTVKAQTAAGHAQQIGGTITTGGGEIVTGANTPVKAAANAMVQRASGGASKPSLKYSRTYGKTTTSGNGQIVANGITAGAAGPYHGDMAKVTKGAANVRNSYGMNASAGYDDTTGNITLNGYDTGHKASEYAYGVTPESVEQLRAGYTAASGDAIVWARQAAEAQGLGNLVRWDPSSKRVSIAGIDVPYVYITDDGNAMVSAAVLNKVMQQVKRQIGADTPTSVTDSIYNNHRNAINSAVKKVVNRDEWTYNPNEDPSYKAYADMYSRNAEQAYNRAMGSGGLYGAPSGYQMYQALAAYGDNMQRLSDTVQQLAAQAYERYSDEQARNLAALNALREERASELNAYYGANADQLSRIHNQDQINYDRRNDAVYTYPMQKTAMAEAANQLTQSNEYTSRYGSMLDMDMRIKTGSATATEIANITARVEAAQQRAAANGGTFLKEDMDALGISPDYTKYPNSGGYPRPWDAEIMAKLAEWEQYQKKVARESVALGL